MEVDSGSGAKSDPTSTMHAISSISSPSPTPPPHSVSSSLSTALELKAAATAAVAAGEWQKAIGKYVRIFAYVQGLRLSSNSPAAAMMALSGRAGSAEADVTAEQKAQIDDLLLSTNTNLALCYSKLAQHDRVIHFATKALELQGGHVKALYRRGVAYRLKGQLERSREDLSRAAELAPSDAAIRAELALLRKDDDAQEHKMRQQFAGMFSR